VVKIAVVGTGYVGLVTGTCFAETGNEVLCVDIDKSKVDRMQKGEIPIYEPGLDILFHRNIKEGRLTFTTDLSVGIAHAEVVFLALPTPPGEDGSADLSYILGAADTIGPLLKHYTIIVDKSTVPVGTAQKVHEHISRNAVDEFDVISNPEFLREGFAVEDFMKPDRVVIGSSSQRANDLLRELYEPFVRSGSPVLFMDERSAEMTKYAANSFLATKISFMNEIANLCEETGADVDSVRFGIGADERIGKRFLFPGIGYGGSCFPKDVKALINTSEKHGYNFAILDAVERVNALQKQRLIIKLKRYYGGSVKGMTFALWGLAFKPDTDDIREAPALELINQLILEGAKVKAFDPEAMENVKKYIGPNPGIEYSDNEYEALDGADALIIATEWKEFRSPDFKRVKGALKKPVIFDGRNLYDVKKMDALSFDYESIGREAIKHEK
jgi:UDPglucose 6-dehydrogenase